MPLSFDFDELNRLTRYAYSEWQKSDKPIGDLLDSYLDLLIMAYLYGVDDANTELGSKVSRDEKYLAEIIDIKIAGKTWAERIAEYAPVGESEEIVRVIETDGHRVYSDGKQHTATRAGAKYKKWQTARDDRVRDTHDYLENMTIGIDERFYTYDGDSALAPSGFTLAANNVNCRCWLEYTK